MADPALAELTARFKSARERRAPWEALWRDCFAYALPVRDTGPGQRDGIDTQFDGTAADAVEQLAASLLAELAPPWSAWLALEAAPGVSEREATVLAPDLEAATRTLLAQFDRSNLAVELHQAFLDLACVGTATLAVEEAATSEASAFRFTALATWDVFLESGPGGQVRGHFRVNRLRARDVLQRWGAERLGSDVADLLVRTPDRRLEVVEAVLPDGDGYNYTAYVADLDRHAPTVLEKGRFRSSPFVTFRWTKSAGDVYGRAPIMTALADIKTANKVVELVLKNAAMAVTGMWQADDDGVLNPHNLRLVPGAVIPKAPGSSGLTPLATPGRFDVSDLILDDLRARIRHTLLVDRLGPVGDGRMTATEVLERSAEAARLLGAIYGRLHAELLDPLFRRALNILVRRGEVPPMMLDRRVVQIRHRGPLARAQARDDVRHVLAWLDHARTLGEAGLDTVDQPAVARWLARTLGVPADLVRDQQPGHEALEAVMAAITEA